MVRTSQYAFDSNHTPGSPNCVADCLSRYPIEQPDDVVEEELEIMHGQIISVQPITLGTSPISDSSKIQDQERKDKTIQHISDQLINGKRRLPYTMENGILRRTMHRYGQTPFKLPATND
ncbi:unnamed protein product [Didymodactylos carnosus]|uniref:Uncharacterized protein n=1 Tax=Didymodactylos carnosus TaxID=1234261 RepID=A0A815NUA2_9BILA|nr:unnamed protein product [Didymodactylos carnosus]CAF1443007.1 unnamed protein product [Didymodactylos carnosus]CAF4066374.1 unnamed protein product [Didymodactylos carnosus]CAF4318531.1 unnamed protein product [Didymodactylos carnosus]